MKRFAVVTILFAFLVGCAQPYKRYGAPGLGGGYADVKIQEGIYEIKFANVQNRDLQRARDFCLLRASEVTLEEGYSFFMLLTKDHSPVKRKHDLFPLVQTHVGDTAYLTIRCLRSKPDVGLETIIFDAYEVKSNLKRKYKIK